MEDKETLYSILFYSILFYSILFYSILFYSILYKDVNYLWCAGYVYTAPSDMLDSQPGTLMLTDCIDTCRKVYTIIFIT
jgi:hypothetical protein